MGFTERAIDYFIQTQTDEKLRLENIKDKNKANEVHYAVEAKIIETIKELDETMLEDLEASEKSVKQIEKEEPKKLKSGDDKDE